jgi:hypothetical protein
MTPSPPTFSIASATSSPIAGSLCAEIVATCAFSLRLSTGFATGRERLGSLEPAVEAALEVDRARAGRDVAHAFGEDRVREDRRRARAVADRVAGLLGRLAQHLRTEVLLRIFELHLLRDRHAVVADEGAPHLLLDQHGLRFRSERDAHGIRELSGAAQDLLPCGGTK